jgi:hypothetical protein
VDSRIIYESAKTYIQKITWSKPSNNADSEWVFIDTEDNIDNITKIIQDFFITEQLYIALNRHQSFVTDNEIIGDKITPLIGKTDFSIWNSSFEKVIQFNKIGVYRKGIKTSH